MCTRSLRFGSCLGRAPLEADPAWWVTLTDKPCIGSGFILTHSLLHRGLQNNHTIPGALFPAALSSLQRVSWTLPGLPFCAEPFGAPVDPWAALQPLPAPWCFLCGFAVQLMKCGSQHRGTAAQPSQHQDGAL